MNLKPVSGVEDEREQDQRSGEEPKKGRELSFGNKQEFGDILPNIKGAQLIYEKTEPVKEDPVETAKKIYKFKNIEDWSSPDLNKRFKVKGSYNNYVR